jgi:hypothetical protein
MTGLALREFLAREKYFAVLAIRTASEEKINIPAL